MAALTAFAPYRLWQDRPYFKDWVKGGDHRLTSLLSCAMQPALQHFRDTGDPGNESNLAGLRAAELSTAVATFFACGQAVFYIEPKLASAFLDSDVSEVRFADVRTPFDCLYLHFGAHLGLTFNDGAATLEGVVIERRTEELQIVLLGCLNERPGRPWQERYDESLQLIVSPALMERPMLRAIDEIVANQVRRAHPEAEDIDKLLGDLDDKEREDVLSHWAKQAPYYEAAGRSGSVLKQCATLVANALLYITAYKDDVKSDWQDGTPHVFRDKVDRATGKSRDRALSKARSAGFTPIHRVGRQFIQAEDDAQTTGSDRKGPSPHMRRSHWRNQPYGPQNALRRLTWIRTARVLGATVRGDPYAVESSRGALSAHLKGLP